MRYEGVGFNVKMIKEMSEKQFINHISYQHLWPDLTMDKRKERLKELYNLINADNKES